MPRKPRFILPGVPQHVIQRANNCGPCFYTEADYRYYLAALQTASARNHCRLHAYVLMTNHVHLLITPFMEHGISHTMQDVGRKYVRYINTTYHRSGTLWQGRYKASLVDSEAYLLTCMRYIEMNPVRANRVRHPGDYRWSSYYANAYGKDSPLIQPHPLYQALGATADTRQRSYRELFRHVLDDDLLTTVRTALNEELVLGRDNFKDRIEDMAQRRVRRGINGRPRIEEAPGAYYVV